jgi:hypothetical protein
MSPLAATWDRILSNSFAVDAALIELSAIRVPWPSAASADTDYTPATAPSVSIRIFLRFPMAMAYAILSAWVRVSGVLVEIRAARTADAGGMDVDGAAATGAVIASRSGDCVRVTCMSASCAASIAIASFWRDWFAWLNTKAPTAPIANVTAPTAMIQGSADVDFCV